MPSSGKDDQLLLLREGRILALGSPDQVITSERLSQAFGCKILVHKRSGGWWPEVLPDA